MVNPVSGETIDTKGEYIWLSGYFYQDLEQLHQSQEPDNPKDCASFSIAMSLNIIFGGEVSGADIAEHKSRPIIFQGKFRWYFPGQGPGLPPFSQDDLLNDIFDWFDLPYKAIYQKGGTVDNLIANLKAGDPTIVNISHGPNLLNGVGHAMVLVGYNKLSKEFILLDPAQDQGFHNYAMDQFLDVWLDQPNIFIKSGSMVTVNRLP
jgi:hypothetical protein